MEDFEGHGLLPGPVQAADRCLWEFYPSGLLPTVDVDLTGGSFSLIMEETPFDADGLQLPDLAELAVKQLWHVIPPAAVIDVAAAGTGPGRDELHHDCLQRASGAVNYDHRNVREPTGEEGGGRPMRLLAVLLECAVAVSVGDLPEANRMLLELTHVASPYSPSPAERLVAYFAQAMATRVVSSCLGVCAAPVGAHRPVLLGELELFGDIAPFLKFAAASANGAVAEALRRRDPVHIIDLDATQMRGLQWPSLLHALAARDGGPPRVRMTALGASPDAMAETGRRLCELARRLGVSFEFRAVAGRAGDVDPAVVRTRGGETAAVQWLRRSPSDDRSGTMRLLEHAAPRMVALVEQEVVQAAAAFLDRFAGSLHHYAAVFDALGESLHRDDPGRQRVENRVLAREVTDMLAAVEYSPARGGEEGVASWRLELARRGRFAQVPVSSGAVAEAQAVLAMFHPSHGYTLHHGGDGTLGLGWKGTLLYTASAWTSLLGSQ